MHTPVRVAIQGDRASFHEIAAHQYYKTPITLLYCHTFQDVFDALNDGRVDKAFVATRNSGHGDIKEVHQLIAATKPTVEGEHPLPIQQHLLGLPGARAGSIHTIISHPVALSQCSRYVSNRHTQEYHDTSAAAAFVKTSNNPAFAAIGSEQAAKLHGLDILEASIQNDQKNITIFQSLVL